MSDYLTIEDLKKVYLATYAARTKWQQILLVFDVSPNTIDSIKCNEKPDDCYLEGLKVWLRSGKRSWKDIVKALSSSIVGYNELARTIERDHLQSAGKPSLMNQPAALGKSV